MEDQLPIPATDSSTLAQTGVLTSDATDEKRTLELLKLKLEVEQITKRTLAKTDLEIQKLQAEIDQLRVVWWKRSASIPFILAGVSLVSGLFGALAAQFRGEYDVARIRMEVEQRSLAVDLKLLNEERRRLAEEVVALEAKKMSSSVAAPK